MVSSSRWESKLPIYTSEIPIQVDVVNVTAKEFFCEKLNLTLTWKKVSLGICSKLARSHGPSHREHCEAARHAFNSASTANAMGLEIVSYNIIAHLQVIRMVPKPDLMNFTMSRVVLPKTRYLKIVPISSHLLIFCLLFKDMFLNKPTQ